MLRGAQTDADSVSGCLPGGRGRRDVPWEGWGSQETRFYVLAVGGILVAAVSGNRARTDHFVLYAGVDEVRTQDARRVSCAAAVRGESSRGARV